MAAQTTVVALAGNPNVGKSTIFNALTGARQHVGNWPGKTVEKKEGWATIAGHDVMLVDLPGTYSLAAYSVEEIIARDFLVHEHPAIVVAVVDASNLERNLYLVCQLMELGKPVVIALNMSDSARRLGMTINTDQLSQEFGCIPVVEMVGSQRIGIDALKSAITRAKAMTPAACNLIAFSEPLEAAINTLQAQIAEVPALSIYPSRWLAQKLLETDGDIEARVEKAGASGLIQTARAMIESITEALDDDPETLITDQRYQFITDAVGRAVTRPDVAVETASDRADKIITSRYLGLPIFLLMMWTVFQFTANVSAPFVDWIDSVAAGPVTRGAMALLGALGLSGTWFEELLVGGVIAGVGSVLVFIPVLLLLYLLIAVLEDSGYMARAAFVMDRVMRAIGLHGKSFLPLLVGFGCTVPAIYATRTLEHEHDRKLTGFLATFMSCGARLPVYVVFATAFFGAQSGNTIFALYILGIGVALMTGLLMKRTVFRGTPPPPFVMELPPYRLPNPKTVLMQTWERTFEFVRRATTVILICSILIWLLMATPRSFNFENFNHVAPEESLFGTVSGAVAPALAPAGFGNWQAAGSLITGIVAKEVVVGTMGLIYSGDQAAEGEEVEPALSFSEEVTGVVQSFGEAAALTVQEVLNIVPRTVNLLPLVDMPEVSFFGAEEEEDLGGLQGALTRAFTPLSALSFMVFVLLYVPCMTAVAAMRHEFGGRWTLYQMGYTLLVAWAGAVIVYQLGTLLGFGAV